MRKARVQVQQTVAQFLLWWVKMGESWSYQEPVIGFVEACRDIYPVAHAAALLQRYFNKLDMPSFPGANSVA